MFILGNFLVAIATILEYVLMIVNILIVIRALISWVNPDPYNPIVRFLQATTEPILAPIRRKLPMFSLGIDISPIIAFLAIMFLQKFLVGSLFDLATRCKGI